MGEGYLESYLEAQKEIESLRSELESYEEEAATYADKIRAAETRSDEAVQEYQGREIKWKRRAKWLYTESEGLYPDGLEWFEEE